MHRHAVPLQAGIMVGGAVALVAAPVVAGMFVMQPDHQPVARHLGDGGVMQVAIDRVPILKNAIDRTVVYDAKSWSAPVVYKLHFSMSG